MNLFKAFVGILGLLLGSLFGNLCHAKDLTGRPGLGFVYEFGGSANTPIPAVSLKYASSKGVAWELDAGFTTATPSATALGGKVYGNIFYEPNLNFYTTLGAAFLHYDWATGFELILALGVEFFIPGVDSVGFAFDAGVSGGNATPNGNFVVRTIGYSFINAGMHFYF